jgi:hypothetical protein
VYGYCPETAERPPGGGISATDRRGKRSSAALAVVKPKANALELGGWGETKAPDIHWRWVCVCEQSKMMGEVGGG